MTIDEIAEKLEDIGDEANNLGKILENLDISELSGQKRAFITQAIKLAYTASSALEEASQYLNED